jgi:acyl dehydratase
MRSFDAMIGAASFKELDPLLRAETLALDDRPAEALPIYVEHLGRTRMIGTSRWLSVFLADRAWCHARTGDLGVAAIDGEAAEAALSPETQIDDRAATHSRLAHVFAMLRNEQKAAIHLAAAQQTWRDVESLQMRFVELAGIFVDR